MPETSVPCSSQPCCWLLTLKSRGINYSLDTGHTTLLPRQGLSGPGTMSSSPGFLSWACSQVIWTRYSKCKKSDVTAENGEAATATATATGLQDLRTLPVSAAPSCCLCCRPSAVAFLPRNWIVTPFQITKTLLKEAHGHAGLSTARGGFWETNGFPHSYQLHIFTVAL